MRISRTIAAAVLTVLAGCSAPATPHSARSTAAFPYVSLGPDLTTTLDHPITRKRHYPPGTWSPDSPQHERWDFCFDQVDGGYSCIPVSAADYQLYDVGDRVQLRQEAGQLAVISAH